MIVSVNDWRRCQVWTTRSEELTNMRGLRFFVDLDAEPATFSDVIRGWQDDVVFRAMFNGVLAAAPFSAFRWETPHVTRSTVTRAFEFVLLDSPGLARRPDPGAFAEHFRKSPKTDVVEFPNLGGDAMMIAPCMKTPLLAYGHLAAFVREAPDAQRHALWQLVGEAMDRRLSARPVWLNTAGGGVNWLHVRLDNRPKYYNFDPYRLAR